MKGASLTGNEMLGQAIRGVEVSEDRSFLSNALDRRTADVFLKEAIQKYTILALGLKAILSEGFTIYNFPLKRQKSARDFR
jgi:hypothetical protein